MNRLTFCVAPALFAIMALVCLATVSRSQAQTPVESAIRYRFVNNTQGKFTDSQCFWSLDGGRQWHAFAKEPTVVCPIGNGRVYLHVGTVPRNLDDREATWDFIEYAFGGGVWHGNTTQVDAFCLPITLSLGGNRVGIVESRTQLFQAFRKETPKEFAGCVHGSTWILSPCRAGFGERGPNSHYFDAYIANVWRHYQTRQKTPSGKWIGEVVGDALIFTPTGGGEPVRCERKPTTQEAFLGTAVLAQNPRFCAAINRHVLADPADWNSPAAFYRREPYNAYARFFHEHSIDHKAYGFCYDDVAEQAAFFSGRGSELVVTVGWDSPAHGRRPTRSALATSRPVRRGPDH